MAQDVTDADVRSLPLAPRNPLPLRELVKLVRRLDTGQDVIRDAGGPVTRIQLGPARVVPPIVAVMSPAGMRDVLGRNDAATDRCIIHEEVRGMAGDSLFVLPNRQWRPRKRALQPVFTKASVRNFGGHMASAAQAFVDRWPTGGEVDLDVECRRVAMQSLGRSVLGIDLNERGDTIARCMHVASSYTADRALRPVRAPRWLPTRSRRRARAAVDAMRTITDEMVAACSADPDRDAPLVQALIAARDPQTDRPLTDAEISNDLLIFMLAGHDTTATALTYALWILGHHPEVQERVAAEAAALGDRELTPADVSRLGYTVQVLHEAVRLCPPAAGVARVVTRDIEVTGYRVEKGSLVALGLYALHHDPELWPDPMAFDPDRFSPENVQARDRWQFLPFLGGGRPCIGEHFARLETTLALATVVRAMTVESLDDDFECEVPFTTVAKGPIRARLTPRS
ncbi:cytochrome P450 [Mycolicibacterium chubuense]|uniref:Pentalenene oxygenase n=1 Tax=Mycolicibacterium chubuense TaxID=1800 RepID=A0A0J6VNR8_MYCCU|nr:cytochrome P450 [Mycolicibacterium chubuense]KMO71103.1 Pentalenene oxygenase [Mycolicibacterium chubuense]ORA52340.1 cytochrome P450 [Mycolicibacterium chubuense]SPX99644.1 cytochrome P450 [Mycolicibacterium chubuense]